MATSAISNGTILQACATGASLPPNSALTKEGEPTTDPNRAEILLPLGGPKGSGLGFMFEMLASVLATAPIQAPALGPERRKSLSQNMAILAVDVATFRPIVDFARDADALAAVIKSLPRQAGFDEIRLPGERAARTEAVRRKSGIPIPGKLWDELRAMAEANAVEMPRPFPA
jgi:ureidoglycolate dehydrogenase (NAD+)